MLDGDLDVWRPASGDRTCVGQSLSPRAPGEARFIREKLHIPEAKSQGFPASLSRPVCVLVSACVFVLVSSGICVTEVV